MCILQTYAVDILLYFTIYIECWLNAEYLECWLSILYDLLFCCLLQCFLLHNSKRVFDHVDKLKLKYMERRASTSSERDTHGECEKLGINSSF